MKFFETLFIDYILQVEKCSLHSLSKIEKGFPDDIKKLNNKIFYGSYGIGKYSLVLYMLKKYSPTKMKYERKIKIQMEKKKEYYLKLSDIHFEIDMSLLGCNAKILWNIIYKDIVDIISTRPSLSGIIVCKNYHHIHSELLDCFYSYMQSTFYKDFFIRFILITEHISFIPSNILNMCSIIRIPKPSNMSYYKCFNQKQKGDLYNIKNLKGNIQIFYYRKLCNDIIEIIENVQNDLFYKSLREALYNILIYNIDIFECIWYILEHFIRKKKINDMGMLFLKLSSFLKYYNNNYRPIYHLERFFLYISSDIHGFQKKYKCIMPPKKIYNETIKKSLLF